MNNTFDQLVDEITVAFSAFFSDGGDTISQAQGQVSGLDIAAGFFSIFFITVILYSLVRIYEIRKEEKKRLHLADLF